MPKFCSECGTKLLLNQEQTKVYCPNCGRIFGADGQVITAVTTQNNVISVVMDVGDVANDSVVVGYISK